MKIGDLVSGGQIRMRAIVMQGRSAVQFELLRREGQSLAWLERRAARR
jgi:hypothetical protein